MYVNKDGIFELIFLLWLIFSLSRNMYSFSLLFGKYNLCKIIICKIIICSGDYTKIKIHKLIIFVI